jgi:hypothetical protein
MFYNEVAGRKESSAAFNARRALAHCAGALMYIVVRT